MCYTGRCKHEGYMGDCTLTENFDCPEPKICPECKEEFAGHNDETICRECSRKMEIVCKNPEWNPFTL